MAALRERCQQARIRDQSQLLALAIIETNCLRWEGSYPAAKLICDRDLKKVPDPVTADYIELLHLRVTIILDDLSLRGNYLADASEDAAQEEKLATSAKLGKALVARAMADAGRSFFIRAATGENQAKQGAYARQTLSKFSEAISLDANNRAATEWRLMAAEASAFYLFRALETLNQEELNDYKAQALSYLDEAGKDQRITADQTTKIANIRRVLEGLKK
jgi:hypothetical protein